MLGPHQCIQNTSFSSQWPNPCACPEHLMGSLLYPATGALPLHMVHTHRLRHPLPQFCLHVCFLCRPQPPRWLNQCVI